MSMTRRRWRCLPARLDRAEPPRAHIATVMARPIRQLFSKSWQPRMAGSSACSTVPDPRHSFALRWGKARVEVRTAGSKPMVLLAGLLLAGAAGGLAAQFNGDLPAFVIVALAQGAVWAVAAAIVLRSPDRPPVLALILGTAVLLRLIALAAPVFLSDDINRYIWDGRVQAAGINPYRFIPTDPELARLRDPLIFPNINRNNYAPT